MPSLSFAEHVDRAQTDKLKSLGQWREEACAAIIEEAGATLNPEALTIFKKFGTFVKNYAQSQLQLRADGYLFGVTPWKVSQTVDAKAASQAAMSQLADSTLLAKFPNADQRKNPEEMKAARAALIPDVMHVIEAINEASEKVSSRYKNRGTDHTDGLFGRGK